MKFAVSFPEGDMIRYAYCVDESTDTFTVVSSKIKAPEQNTETTVKDIVPLFNQEIRPEIPATF